MKNLLFTFIFMMLTNVGFTQSDAPSPVLFIYDASGSMWGQIEGKTKKEIASEVLSSAVNQLSDDQNIGLVAYGHRRKGDCEDVEFLVDLNNQSKLSITETIGAINPLGKTPLAHSADLAINSIKDFGEKATIILITDGIESCDGDICKIVSVAKAAGIDFKLHIVGFGIKEAETEELRCAAEAGEGNYYNAEDSDKLGKVLNEALSKTIDDPNENVSIFATKNGKAVDAWIKVKDKETSKDIANARSYRDSAWVYLPAGNYNIQITPLENTDIPATNIQVSIEEGEVYHHDVSFDGGKLEVNASNNEEICDAVVKMYDPISGKVIANARTYGGSKTMEIPAGVYKVSFQALAMKGLSTYHEYDDVLIKSNETTVLEHIFETGIAMIGVKTKDGELIDATVNFTEIDSGKNVAGSRTYTSDTNNPREFILNPGTYEVKIITLGKHKGNKKTITVQVSKGETVTRIIEF